MAIDPLSINPVPFDGSSVVQSLQHYGDVVQREQQVAEAKTQREMEADLKRLNAPAGKPYEKDIPLLTQEYDRIDGMIRQYYGDRKMDKYEKAKLRGDIDKAQMQWKMNSALSAEHAQQNWKEKMLYATNPELYDEGEVAARNADYWDNDLNKRMNSGSKMPTQLNTLNVSKGINAFNPYKGAGNPAVHTVTRSDGTGKTDIYLDPALADKRAAELWDRPDSHELRKAKKDALKENGGDEDLAKQDFIDGAKLTWAEGKQYSTAYRTKTDNNPDAVAGGSTSTKAVPVTKVVDLSKDNLNGLYNKSEGQVYFTALDQKTTPLQEFNDVDGNPVNGKILGVVHTPDGYPELVVRTTESEMDSRGNKKTIQKDVRLPMADDTPSAVHNLENLNNTNFDYKSHIEEYIKKTGAIKKGIPAKATTTKYDYSKAGMQGKAKELGITEARLKEKILAKKPNATFEE